MIANTQQYEFTKVQIANFEQALWRFAQESTISDPVMRDIYQGELQMELDKLRQELMEYESKPQTAEVTNGPMDSNVPSPQDDGDMVNLRVEVPQLLTLQIAAKRDLIRAAVTTAVGAIALWTLLRFLHTQGKGAASHP